MPQANKCEWGDKVINSLSRTESVHAYGRYAISSEIGECDVVYAFGSVKIKFR